MARPPEAFRDAAKGYVPVRVTNMAGVDLNTYRFDYDLTFAALLMNADGTIYHTYGGRDFSGATSHLSMDTFVALLKRTLPRHAAHKPVNRSVKLLTPEMLARRAKHKGKVDCVHCHTVHDWMTEAARAAGRFRQRDAFRWQDPFQVGLRLDKHRQTTVTAVTPDSPAAKAGLQPGDRILAMKGLRVATFGDIQRALHEAPDKATTLPLTLQRGKVTLRLGKDWKVPAPDVFAWRASMWPLSPKPGFGGRKHKDGIFKIGYLVTWGKNAHTGRNAARAGLRKGDIVVSVNGRKDFESEQHFQAWFRLTQKAGRRIPIEILRNGQPMTIKLKLLD